MANRLYQKALGKLCGGASSILYLTDTMKVVALSSGYTPDTTSTGHEFLSDITAGFRLGTATLSGKTISAVGAFDSADPTISGVTGTVTQLAVYRDTGTEATSALLGLVDTATNMPTAALSSQSVTVGWPVGGMFKVG